METEMKQLERIKERETLRDKFKEKRQNFKELLDSEYVRKNIEQEEEIDLMPT